MYVRMCKGKDNRTRYDKNSNLYAPFLPRTSRHKLLGLRRTGDLAYVTRILSTLRQIHFWGISDNKIDDKRQREALNDAFRYLLNFD